MATYDVKDASGQVYTVSDGAPAPQPQEQPSTWGRVQAMAGGADEMLFGAGHAGAALARTIVNGKNYGQNWTDIAQERQSAEGANPEAYHSGQALGVGLSLPVGGAAGDVARGIVGVKNLAQGASVGARAVNAGRAVVADAATGASMGAAAGAGNTGTAQGAATGAEVGGAVGAAAGAVAPVIGAAANAVRNYTPWRKAVQILGDSIKLPGESDAQATARLTSKAAEYKAIYGNVPSLAELSDEPQMRDVAAVSGRTVTGQRTAADLEANAAAARPGEMAGVIKQGGPTVAPTRLRLQAQQDMDAAMGSRTDPAALRNQPVLSGSDVEDLLANPKIAKATAGDPDLADTINSSIGGRGALSVDDMDNLRQQLGAQAKSAGNTNSQRAMKLKDARDEITRITTDAHAAYGAALDNFSSTMAKAEGVELGSNLGGESEAPARVEQAGYGSGPRPAAVQSGIAPGMRTYLAERANKNPDSAVRLANDLTNSAELRAQVRAALPPDEAERVLLAGKLANKSTIGLAAVTPKQGTLPAEAAQQTGTALRAGMLAFKGGSASFEAHNAIDWLTRLGYPAGTAKYLANMAGSRDENTVRGVLNELSKRGTTAVQRHAFMNAVRSRAAGAAGNIAGASQ